MSTVVYDGILGKLREAEISGGTGGGGGVQTVILGGYRISVTSAGSSATVDQDKWFPITNVTGASVTMQPGDAYKIQATTSAVTINTTEIPANQYGLESHLEIFVANTGYIVTGSNVVLANALEPDAVNNCTVRFHDGYAIISVEDHVAGYIVTVNAASGAGSLAYGLSTATNEYVSVDASLNGQTLDLGGVTTYAGEKHVVGNGYTETIVSGGITCTNKTTFSNLGMNGVVVSSGTLTMGDVSIPNGATVAVSGGGLAVENVSGNGGTINLGGKQLYYPSGSSGTATGVSITGATTGAFNVVGTGRFVLSNCVFSGNTYSVAALSYAGAGRVGYGAVVEITDCSFGVGQGIAITKDDANSTTLKAGGSNSFLGIIAGGGYMTISSGAIIDLTGNTNTAPITPAGGIIVNNGCTVINSAGTTVPITGGTYTKINNDGTTVPPQA